MKILIAIDDFNPRSTGGSAVVVENLIDKLSKKHKIAILSSHRKGKQLIKKTHKNFTHYSVKVNYPEFLRGYLSLYNPISSKLTNRALSDFKPDKVEAHTIHMYLTYNLLRISKKYTKDVAFIGHDVMPIFYGRLTKFVNKDNNGFPSTIDPRFNFFREIFKNKLRFNPLRNLIIRWYLNQVSVVTVSHALKNVYQLNGIRVDRVIHNQVNKTKWRIDRHQVDKFKKKYNLNNKNIITLFGRIRKDKGALQAVKVLSLLPSKYTLLVVGKNNNDTNQMLLLAQKLHIEDRVIFTGQLKGKKLIAAYHSSSLVLVPSICFDSYPNSVIEAIVCEKPIVASEFGGANEAIKNYSSGAIVNPFDTKKTAQQVIRLIKTT